MVHRMSIKSKKLMKMNIANWNMLKPWSTQRKTHRPAVLRKSSLFMSLKLEVNFVTDQQANKTQIAKNLQAKVKKRFQLKKLLLL